MNATRTFLGGDSLWPAARCCLIDVQGLRGGRAVYVWGGGMAIVRIISPGPFEERYRVMVGESEAQLLLGLFIEQDFLTIEVDLLDGSPDEARPSIKLINAGGQFHAVEKWVQQRHDRFDCIYAELIKFEEMAATANRIYDGKADWDFVPEGFESRT